MAVFFPSRQKQVGLDGVEVTPAGILKLSVVPPPPPELPGALPLDFDLPPLELEKKPTPPPAARASAEPELEATLDAQLERTRDPMADRTQITPPLRLDRVEATRVIEDREGREEHLESLEQSEMPSPPEGIEYADPLVGATLDDRYRIGGFIGAGAMGRVYEGIQIAVGRTVAVKVINRLQVRDEASITRFKREARVQAQMTHPNIVHLFDFGRHDDTIYLVMEHVSGHSLREVIREGAPFTAPRAAGLMVQLLRALAAAHGRGVVHRDLKPANLLVMPLDDGREILKVADFGLALQKSSRRHTPAEGGLVGSPRYMSPEQASAGEATAASDIYAFGAVLYEMLTGEYANPGRTAVEVIRRQLAGPPPRVTLADPRASWMLDLALECLAYDPASRPSSAVELLTRLEEAGVVAPRGQHISADNTPLGTDPQLATSPPRSDTPQYLEVYPQHAQAPEPLQPTPRPVTRDAPRQRPRARAPLPIIELMATLIVAALVWVGLDFVDQMEADRAAEAEAAAQAAAVESPLEIVPVAAESAGVVELPAAVVETALPPEQSLELVTRPRGALVISGDKVLGMTPVQVKWAADEAPPTLTIRATGYKDTRIDLSAQDSLFETFEVELPPL